MSPVVDRERFYIAGMSFSDLWWLTKLRDDQHLNEDCDAARRSVASAPGYPYRRESVLPEGDALCGARRSSVDPGLTQKPAMFGSKGSSRCVTPSEAPHPSVADTERSGPATPQARGRARCSAPPEVHQLVPVRGLDEVREPMKTQRLPSATQASLGYFATAQRSVNTQDHDSTKSAPAKEAAVPKDRIQVTVETAVEEEAFEPPIEAPAIHKNPVRFLAGGPQDEATNTPDPQDIESQTQRTTKSKSLLSRVLPTTKMMLTGVASDSLDVLTVKKDEYRPWWKPKDAFGWTAVVIAVVVAMAPFVIAFVLLSNGEKKQ